MTNKKIQEIIDYLESGEKFSKVLISELSRADLTCYEKRTYSSLLDALNGATELYCAMTEWPDNVAFFTNTPESDQINDNDSIIIKHGLGTLEAVQAISDYIKGLALNSITNDKLVKLMTDMLRIAEQETYIQGFVDCMKAVQNGGFKGLEDKIEKFTDLKIEGKNR